MGCSSTLTESVSNGDTGTIFGEQATIDSGSSIYGGDGVVGDGVIAKAGVLGVNEGRSGEAGVVLVGEEAEGRGDPPTANGVHRSLFDALCR